MPLDPLRKKLTDIGHAVAERKLTADGEEILVRLGEPQPFPDGEDWYCPYEVVRGTNKRVHFAAGVDSLQALQLALKGLATDVFVLNRDLNHNLRWLENNELGFTNYDGEKF